MNKCKRVLCVVIAMIFILENLLYERHAYNILAENVTENGNENKGGEQTDIEEPKQLYSLSAVLMDADTGRVLFEKDGYTVRANASTTKIMTCILAIESGKLDELVTVSKYAASMPDVQLNIKEGERYLLSDLLYSLMLESHNDVAVAIAEHISGDVKSFANLMNDKARELGCVNTNFITPNGLDASEDSPDGMKIHGTTAADLARIMAYCVKNEEFLKITQTASYTFSNRTIDKDGTQKIGGRKFTVNNKNAFLHMMDGVLSGKTGFTGDAGYCYVGALENGGRTYTIALLGCGWPNNKTYKWSDSKKLFNYGIENYTLTDFFNYDISFQEIRIENGVWGDYASYGSDGINADKTPYISVYVEAEALNFLHRSDEKLEYEILLDNSMEAPIYEGEIIGKLVYTFDGEAVREYDIKSAETIEKKDFKWAIKCIFNKFVMN